MKILVANNHLNTFGGTETFTFTLIEELVKLNHTVEYFTLEKGVTSEFIETKLEVKSMQSKSYDLILANHTTCVEFLRLTLGNEQTIIQTCHGLYHELEQPSIYANYHVAISEEINIQTLSKGFESEVILNGINCDRFKPNKAINQELKTILSLCQSKEANDVLKSVSEKLNVNFIHLNKHVNPIWNVEKEINNADLVVGLGRSAYEAMACGRNVLIYDNRSYFDSYSDGYLNEEIINQSIKNNCSGRRFKKEFSIKEISEEIQKYDPENGVFLRKYALSNLNMQNQCKLYLNIATDKLKFKEHDPNEILKKIASKVILQSQFYLPFLNFNHIVVLLKKKDTYDKHNLISLFEEYIKEKELVVEEHTNTILKKDLFVNQQKDSIDELILMVNNQIETTKEKELIINKYLNIIDENNRHITNLNIDIDKKRRSEKHFKSQLKRIKKSIMYKTLVKMELWIRQIKKVN